MQIPFFYKPSFNQKGMEQDLAKPSLGYRIAYHWIDYAFNNLYYQKVYRLHTENLPPVGTPTICISNHQNSLCDSISELTTFDMRFLHFICRADVFKKKNIGKLLYAIGLIPIYRVRDGVGKIKDNLQMFSQVEKYVAAGNTLVIYPEATHMDGNWLGQFYLSYTRIGFEAAESTGFEKEVFIFPIALYYHDFKQLRTEMVVDCGEPVSLMPYYAKYKENPREAEKEANEYIRSKVKEKVLDVKDLDHYDTVMDFFSYVEENEAQKRGLEKVNTVDEWEIRKHIESKLEEKMEREPALIERIYSHTTEFSKFLKKHRINNKAFENPFKKWAVCGQAILYALLFPLFLAGMIPHILLYSIIPVVMKKVEDKLMHASIDLCIWVLDIPLFYLIYFIVLGVCASWLTAVLVVLLLPLLGKFALWYHRNFQQDFQCWRARLIRQYQPNLWKKLTDLRQKLDEDYELLNA